MNQLRQLIALRSNASSTFFHPMKRYSCQMMEEQTRGIESLDKEIDPRIYALYGLTKSEIKIVKGNVDSTCKCNFEGRRER